MTMVSEEWDMELGESRNSLQKIALFAVYDMLTYMEMNQPVDVEMIVSGLCDMPYEDCDPFVKAILILTIAHYGEAVNVFNEHMHKWTFDRLNRVERAILLQAYVHYFYAEKDVDKRVCIDIAIKHAKIYLEDRDYKFVNAILDKVLQR